MVLKSGIVVVWCRGLAAAVSQPQSVAGLEVVVGTSHALRYGIT